MRNRFGKWFDDYVNNCEQAVLLSGDIGYGVFDKLRTNHPRKFLNVGIAEQNMIGVAAGLASKGLSPWVYTITPFLLYRPFDFVRNLICHQNLNVKLVGVGGGVVYDTLGFTHYTLEDLSLCKNLPNLKVFLPYDPSSAERCFELASRDNLPTYIRLMKGGEPDLTHLRKEQGYDVLQSFGSDVLLVGHGSIVSELKLAAEKLKEKKIKCTVLALWSPEALREN